MYVIFIKISSVFNSVSILFCIESDIKIKLLSEEKILFEYFFFSKIYKDKL